MKHFENVKNAIKNFKKAIKLRKLTFKVKQKA